MYACVYVCVYCGESTHPCQSIQCQVFACIQVTGYAANIQTHEFLISMHTDVDLHVDGRGYGDGCYHIDNVHMCACIWRVRSTSPAISSPPPYY